MLGNDALNFKGNTMHPITISSDLILQVIQYLESRPAKETFVLLTNLGQVVSPQFQAIQEQMNAANTEAPVEPPAAA